MKYCIWRINKKTKVPHKIEEGNSISGVQTSIERISRLHPEYNYAIRLEDLEGELLTDSESGSS